GKSPLEIQTQEIYIENVAKFVELSEKIVEFQAKINQETDQEKIDLMTADMRAMQMDKSMRKQGIDDHDYREAFPEDKERILFELSKEIHQEDRTFVEIAENADQITADEVVMSEADLEGQIKTLEETIDKIGIQETIMDERAMVCKNKDLKVNLDSSAGKMNVHKARLNAKLESRREELGFKKEAEDLSDLERVQGREIPKHIVDEVTQTVDEMKVTGEVDEEIGVELASSVKMLEELRNVERG
ncbi:unnamed protein product, partial [marine sediment metagenome]